MEGQYEELFWPGAGLISSVVDMARFDIVLDRNVLLSHEARERMFAPAVSTTGAELPHGLGWFTQAYKGTRLIWHYGWWPPCASSFILKVPDEKVTFILLATTDNLSRPYQLGSGEFLPLDSAVGLAFYKTYVFEPRYGSPVPRVDWEGKTEDLVAQLERVTDSDVSELLERELLSHRRLYHSVGRMDLSDRLERIHRQVYQPSSLDNYAALEGVGNPPAPFVAPFTMYHKVAILGLVLVVLSALVLWPGGYLVRRWLARTRRVTARAPETREAAQDDKS